MPDTVIHLYKRGHASSMSQPTGAGLPAGYDELVRMIESTLPMMESAAAKGVANYLGPIIIVYRWALEELAAIEASGGSDDRGIAMICGLLGRLAGSLPESDDDAPAAPASA